MQKNVKRGFTLIELLVAIAIIAILAAILFPVFARARENARRASCQSNLKQIALGIFMYNQDYDEKLPIIFTSPAGNTSFVAGTAANRDVGWAEAMQPYLKSTQIFQCPSETGAPTASSLADGSVYSDYWLNNIADGQADASFDAPSQTVLLGDGGASSSAYSANGCTAQDCADDASGQKATIPGGGATRHLDGTNFAFADGHVKWLKGVGGTAAATKDLSSAVMNGLTKLDNAGGNATFAIN